MKCPKCGLDLDGKHSPEYYSGCRRCSALFQQIRLLPGKSWKGEEGCIALPLRGDSFCQACGKLLSAPSRYCLTCDSKSKKSGQ